MDASDEADATGDATDAGTAPPDPFHDPGTSVSTWRGKLPPGGMFASDVEVTFPTDPAPPEGYPLMVFAHGFQIGEDQYRASMEHVAKFGYVVASVDYESSLLDQDHHAPVEAMASAIEMLTTTPPPEVGAIVDSARIAAAGHSLGAKGAVWLTLEDDRIDALIALDPVDDDPSPIPIPTDKRPSLTPERMAEMGTPSLYVAAELSLQGQQACAPRESNGCRFYESSPPGVPAWLVVLPAFGHMQFMDAYDCTLCGTCARGPEGDHGWRQAVFRGLMVAFLGAHLRGETAYLDLFDGAGRGQLELDNALLDAAEQGLFCQP